jgi:hypothetical protein
MISNTTRRYGSVIPGASRVDRFRKAVRTFRPTDCGMRKAGCSNLAAAIARAIGLSPSGVLVAPSGGVNGGQAGWSSRYRSFSTANIAVRAGLGTPDARTRTASESSVFVYG